MEELVPLSPEAKAFLEEAKEDLKAIAGKYPALGEWQLSADTKELLEAVTAYLTDLESQAIPPDDMAKEIEGYLPGLKKGFLAPPLPNRFLKQSPDAKFTAHIWLTVLPKLQRFIQDEVPRKAQPPTFNPDEVEALLKEAFEKVGVYSDGVKIVGTRVFTGALKAAFRALVTREYITPGSQGQEAFGEFSKTAFPPGISREALGKDTENVKPFLSLFLALIPRKE